MKGFCGLKSTLVRGRKAVMMATRVSITNSQQMFSRCARTASFPYLQRCPSGRKDTQLNDTGNRNRVQDARIRSSPLQIPDVHSPRWASS